MPDNPTAPEGTPAPEAGLTAVAFTQQYVDSLRQEAAKYRVEKNDAVAAAKSVVETEWQAKVSAEIAKTAEEAVKRGEAELSLAKLQTAIEAGVPTDKLLAFALILQGTDETSLKASAESAKALFGGFDTRQPAVDPTQGSGGTIPSHGLNSDALLNDVKSKLGIL